MRPLHRVPAALVAPYLEGSRPMPELDRLVEAMESELSLVPDERRRRALRALAACMAGVPPEVVSRSIDWKEFESLCAALLRSAGYSVRENVTLRKPRAQIDMVALGHGRALVVDCKHWGKGMGAAALSDAVASQWKRAKRAKEALGFAERPVVVILSLGEVQARFVDGGAVVPVHTLRDFLVNIEAYSSLFEPEE